MFVIIIAVERVVCVVFAVLSFSSHIATVLCESPWIEGRKTYISVSQNKLLDLI